MPCVAVVGATGAVGQEFLQLLAERHVAHGQVRLFASARSAGKTLMVNGQPVQVEALREGCFRGVDIAFFSAGKGVSKEWGPRAVAEGAWVVDNSSAFRMDSAVPLVIPEVNGHVLKGRTEPCIVAVPNCSTIIALMAVAPIHRAVGVARMVVSTYQAASGAGAQAMAELEGQAHEFAAGKPYTTAVFGRQYLFNLFSHNSAVGADGMNEEERKLVLETHKIMEDSTIGVAATCVRVPVLRSHSEAINLTLRKPLTEDAARQIPGKGARPGGGGRPRGQPLPRADPRVRPRPGAAGPHSQRRQPACRPGPVALCGRRPDPQGRCADRHPDRRAPPEIGARHGCPGL